MLPRSQRLSAEQFNAVMEKGRVTHSSLFLIRSVGDMGDTRIAATVPLKVSKTAVVRNRFRRKIYEAVRMIKMAVKPGTHTIIFARTSAIQAKQTDIAADIKMLFVKSGILR